MFKKLIENGAVFIKKASSFGEAVVDHLLEDGFEDVSDEHYYYRLGICSTCPTKDEKSWTCNNCGCDMLLKAKWGSSECPEKKWGKISLTVLPTTQPLLAQPTGNCGCGS